MEFAIIMTILFLLVFGIFEWGRVESEIQVLEGAAREGSRRAAVGQPYDEVVQAVMDHAAPYTPSSTIEVDNPCGGTNTVGQQVTVRWTQTLSVSIPLWGDSTIDRVMRGVFRCEL